MSRAKKKTRLQKYIVALSAEPQHIYLGRFGWRHWFHCTCNSDNPVFAYITKHKGWTPAEPTPKVFAAFCAKKLEISMEK